MFSSPFYVELRVELMIIISLKFKDLSKNL